MSYTVIKNQSLLQYNTLRLQSKASIFAFPHNKEGISEVYEKYSDRRIIVLGKGSNILLSKTFYDEHYVFINLKLMSNMRVDVESRTIEAEAGIGLSELSWFALESGFSGFEFLEDIPGSLGGAVIMNAGTYDDSISKIISRVEYFDCIDFRFYEKTIESSDFGRRKSFWSEGKIITRCEFAGLNEGLYVGSLDKILATKRDRYLKQPRNYPNAGSVFIRPIKDGEEYPVWKLIDDVGLRGYRVGGAKISDKHTGFIINTGSATFEDISKIIEETRRRVWRKFGVDLKLEWKVI